MLPVAQTGITLILLTLMIFGLFSLVFIPILPGLVIIWAGAFIYGLVFGFTTPAAWILFGLITALMIGGSLIDNVLMGASARRTGAGWLSITVAMVAGMIGSIFLPLFGGILLSLAALFIIEYIRQRNWKTALISTKSMALGCGWAVVARFGMGAVMIALYGGWVLWGR